jgi:hypothetical protein
MGSILRIYLMAAALAMPISAHAQAVTTYDGTYNGVSITGTGCTPPVLIPRPLTINNGTAQFAGGLTGTLVFQGSVTPQGSLTMRSSTASVVTGRIDPAGKVTAGTGGVGCTMMYVWQKK